MEKSFDLQMFASMFAAPGPGPEPAPQPSPQPQPSPNIVPQPTPQPTPQPDENLRRNIVNQARQTWETENQHALQLAKILKEEGRDPGAVVTELEQRRQQARAQEQFGGQVDPRLAAHIQGLETQLNEFKTNYGRAEGMRQLQAAEANATEMLKPYGIEYGKPEVQQAVRQFAYQNNIGIEQAVKLMMFDRIIVATNQQAEGAALAALQGRGQLAQPVTSAVPGAPPAAQKDWRTASRDDWAKERARLRGGY